jgi:hypothetical protein
VVSSSNRIAMLDGGMDKKFDESGDLCVEAALSKSGGGVYLFGAFTELVRAPWMVIAAVERELRVALVSAWRMSAARRQQMQAGGGAQA